MSIRDGDIDDLDMLLPLFEEAYSMTPFKNMTFKKTAVIRWFAVSCSFPDKFYCKVVIEDSKPVGILVGMVDENVWGVPVAQTLVSYSRKDTHKLIRGFVEWAKQKDVSMITLTTVPGKERYKTLIERMGFVDSGQMYTLGV